MTILTRRRALGATLAALSPLPAAAAAKVVDVMAHGAVGDGTALDTAAIQRAIDAAEPGARVLLPGGKIFLTGPLRLKGGIDFHLAEGAELRASPRPEDYPDPKSGVLGAFQADRLTLSGKGTINGQSPLFMAGYDQANEWWTPKPFRPRLVVLEACADLVIRDIRLVQAPSWTVHLLGCRRVLVDGVTIRNQTDVPNCDGIDPDHCQEVEIRHCDITCGDDGIVIKTTAGHEAYGPSRNITVRDCVFTTQDSGVKIGTETTQDIHDILFERCRIVQSCRALCIQLRDQGSVYNVTFRDISFVSRYFSAPWWGRGEAISFTALPRTPQTVLGRIHDIRVENVSGRAENSIRVRGFGGSRISDVVFDRVRVAFGRWTAYPGGVFDNRPTTAAWALETHDTVGFSLRTADRITLRHCEVTWLKDCPPSFTHALQAQDVHDLKTGGFHGPAARPGVQAVAIES